ncbi:hypothetical protein M422DRAFT_783920 [Sphaerobolus stellatus SS14]|uniref:Uncharacterized protein n=1 Tax=Sphaerobolus stellatus (strain SS14) TaxID=990650 RepID=A0A0C9U8H8_SPHS4|nr:hypothetical protein M422DRAFT_783920 [Sphaerobolus stellatus SS14]
MASSLSPDPNTWMDNTGSAKIEQRRFTAGENYNIRSPDSSHSLMGRLESMREISAATTDSRAGATMDKTEARGTDLDELKRRNQEMNAQIIQLLIGAEGSGVSNTAQEVLTSYTDVYHQNSTAAFTDSTLVDEIPNLPVWDKNLTKFEMDQKIEKTICAIRQKLRNIGLDLHPTTGDSSLALESMAGGNDDISDNGRAAKPNWQVEYEKAQEEELYEEDLEGDKVSAGRITTEDDDFVILQQGLYAPEKENRRPRIRLSAILEERIVDMDICNELFELFYEKVIIFFSTCDPAVHTVDNVLRASSFLFTTICAVASRYYDKRPELYPRLIKAVQDASGRVVPKMSQKSKTDYNPY